jgi:uncharacterized protein (DUF488 family)
MDAQSLYTIGHGNRKPDELLNVLRRFDIKYLIDVRSQPYSKFNPQFNQNDIKAFLENNGIRYVFMGDSLGGRPKDLTCYDDDGKVNYEIIKNKDFFQSGISRLRTAHIKNIKSMIMCSESKPIECHRSKLIGRALSLDNIILKHIDEKGIIKDQITVINELNKGKADFDLFQNQMNTTSRKSYIKMEFFTIGVYNSTEQEFFDKLITNNIDTFCDIRQRRGVRGSKYAFVNSNSLQNKLAALDIRYGYIPDLAPSTEIREHQKQDDIERGILKSERQVLGSTFTFEYKNKILQSFNFNSFFENLRLMNSNKIVLFCVEENPEACHRSIVSNEIRNNYKYKITHL